MEKKKFKKALAILCVFAILQSYFMYFANIAIAANEGFFTPGGANIDETLGEEEEPNDAEELEEPDEAESEDLGENLEEQEKKEESEIPEENPEEKKEDKTVEEGEKGEAQIGEEGKEEKPEDKEKEPEEQEPYVEPEVALTVTSENANIYKGYLYANATSELKYATDYNTIDKLDIVGGKNISKLTVQDEPDKIQLITNTKIGLMNDMYYRRTRVSVDEFKSILGIDGIIVLYTEEDELIGYINKDTLIENDEYVFYYEAQYNSVKFELINILRDGPISIKNDKSIKETSEFSRNQISLFSDINTIAALNVYVGEEVKGSSSEGNINLEETESRMEIGIDTQDLSVEGKNEVAINVTLRTDEERYDLFENPTIDIEFPSAIETVEVTGMTLLYKNGLTIDNWEVLTNAYGKKLLRINLVGAQLEYTPGAVQEGTTVVAYTSIDVNRLTADTSENLKMTYTNKDTLRKSYSLEGKDSEAISLNFVGRQELVRMSKVTNEVGASVTTYDNETSKMQIEPNLNQRLTITSALVNNYETTLNDVEIIGRIPFVGNKDENGNDLGTNFDSFLVNGIVTTGNLTDIYYSEEAEAESSSTSWTTDVQDFSKIKSFKIVLREKTLAKGERLSFEYTLSIPENVGYNAKGYAVYTAYYKIDNQTYSSQSTVGIYTEEKEIELEDIKEEEKQNLAELTIGTQVSQCGKVLGEEDSVYERQILEYTVVVKNTSDIVANDILLRCKAINANLYTWEYLVEEQYWVSDNYVYRQMREFPKEEKEYEEFTIEKLEPGEEKTFTYQVIVDENAEETQGIILVTGLDIQEQQVQTIKNSVKEALLEVRTGSAGTEDIEENDAETSGELRLYTYVKNIHNEALKNVKAKFILPEEIDFKENYFTFGTEGLDMKVEKVGEKTIVIFDIPSLQENEEKTIYISTLIKEMDYSVISRVIQTYSVAESGNNKYNSNIFEKKITQTKTTVEYTWDAETDKEILEDGDEVTFLFSLRNTGYVPTQIVMITSNLDSGLQIESKEVYINDVLQDNQSNNTRIDETAELNPGDTIFVKTICKVNGKLFERDQDKVEVKAHVEGGGIESFDTNIISFGINNTNITTQGDWPDPEEQKTNRQSNNSSNSESEQQSKNSSSSSSTKTNTSTSTSTVPSKETTYIITGKAWIDSNQDGIRQAKEEPKEAVVVMLYKANSNGGLDTSNAVSTTATNSKGEYAFNNVGAGNYIVVFDYASTKYKVTKYQVQNAKVTENSDAISKNLTINGETRTFGVTDVLTINKASLAAIDIGLVDKTNFDLKLDKKIENVLVKNSSGIRKYNFKNGENARIEIRSKYYKSSVLDITYTFTVTNEGDVAGYVNKVIDYLPDDVEVVLNASPGWYIGQDDNLYYTGLVEEEIEPGETKEFKLVLRKSLANGEAAKLTNSAEIVEYTNMLELYDRDSIENNKEEKEDDFGKAVLIISVSTGNTRQIIATTLMIIIMIAIIAIITIKLKNTKKIYR